MTLLKKQVLICLDCESTGLDTRNDHVIEIAAARFDFDGIIETFEFMIDPCKTIPEESIKIHHITQDMVEGKPTIDKILPGLLEFVGKDIIMGHGISFDINILTNSSQRHSIPCSLFSNRSIDTLRLARHYGESPSNSLEALRQHFNIEELGAHRAMNDVLTNIQVFKRLCATHNTTERVFDILSRPIQMKHMPLGKYKGREFKEIPQNYLHWAAHQNFDQDLMFSIKRELKNRKKGNSFNQSTNPFLSL